jgi:multidrug efflux pump subunit AcrB
MQSFFSPFRTVILFLAVSLAGIALIPKLSVDFNPITPESRLQVTYSMPRSSPEMVERLVTSPLENTLSQVSGIKKIRSQSTDNNGSITLEFEKGTDIEYKKFEVSTLLRNVYPKLPESVSYPLVNQFGGNERVTKGPFLIYTINAPFAPFEIKSQAEEIIRKPLIQIPEIETVDIRGARDLQLTIDLDLPSLIKYRINIDDVAQQVRNSIGNEYPGMAITGSNQQFFIRLEKEIQDLNALEDIVLATYEGIDVKIKDLGRVYLEEQEPNSYFRINANNAITLSITPRDDVNRVVVAAEVKRVIAEAQQLLPEGYTMFLQRDDTEFLKKELDKIYKRTGLSVIILTLFIFVASRNPRYLLTIFVGIIVNLCIASIFIYSFGVNIHLYSLAGITISFGLIMDNAIVMVDHLHRKKNSKVFLALLAASLTTIMALLAVFLLPEEEQLNLIDFSKVVSINLGVSLLIALFFTPALYRLLFKEALNRKLLVPVPRLRKKVKRFRFYQALIVWIARRRGWATFLLIWLFGFPLFFLPTRWEGHDWYNKTLGNEKYLEHTRPWVDKISGGALRMFVRGVYEKMQYREPEQTKLYLTARMPYGNTLQQMNEVIRPFEHYLVGYEGVDKFVTDIRSGQNARIEITFKKAYEMSSIPYQLKGELIARSLDWSGVNWNVYGVGNGFYSGGSNQIPNYRVEMRGYNFDELEAQAQIMANKLLEHRRIQEVDINALSGWNERPMNEYVLTFDAEKMALSGTNQGDLIRMLRNMSKPSGPATSIPLDDRITPVYIKTTGSEHFSKFAMMEDALPLDTSRRVRMKDLAELQFVKTPNTINKEDRQYIRVVAFDYYGSAKFGGEYRDEVLEDMKRIMPVGYSAKPQGWFFSGAKAKRQYGLLLLLMVGIFFVCAILFENLKQPLWIIFSIPISFIGLFLIFSLFNFSFDQGGYAAFLMLGGLVVNAAIFVVNDLNNLRKGNYNRNIIKAVTGKGAPILLTIISTCLGLVPFVMQGQNEIFWFSLAIGTIGGLIFSLIAIFIYLPVFLFKRKLIKA